jgi:putative solute:sodium symporter small subunit
MTVAVDNNAPAARRALIAARAAHWRRARAVTALLLLAWIAITFGTVFFARQLANLNLFGWPLSFYLAAQGACLIYLLLIGGYALWMRRLDRRFARRLAAVAGRASTPGGGPA